MNTLYRLSVILCLLVAAGCETTAGFYVEKDTYTQTPAVGDPDLRTSFKLEFTEKDLFARPPRRPRVAPARAAAPVASEMTMSYDPLDET
ncbi:hypothetical protein Pan216_02460 [Planctomycetes bacterium Pan216]|uniref:Lipoprotein n=1 Tax=Kolteria novifilia TaxID=2527975 RepID=A0A518AXG4_9BACT|nr:hypothetical protein Pan216_02460 [Planctomycetes bacterium Pan216]